MLSHEHLPIYFCKTAKKKLDFARLRAYLEYFTLNAGKMQVFFSKLFKAFLKSVIK